MIAMVYASKTGNTRAVADHIGKKLNITPIDLKKDADFDISPYDTVIIGSGVYAGGMSKRVVKFIDRNMSQLASKDVMLYLRCMYDGEKGDNQLKKIVTNMPFLSSSVYFSGDVKNDMSKVDAFISNLL